MIKQIKIKDKIIGRRQPAFLIAEMACAHQGDIENALNMVKIAVDAGVDAIQLQVFKKEGYISPLYNDYSLISRLELTQNEWLEVISSIKKNNKLLFAAAYDIESIEFLEKNDVIAYKVHSADSSNPEVLEAVAITQKPIFLSCGASKISEIEKSIQFLKKNGTKDIILMHGYQGFPTKIEDCNLKFIKTLENLFNLNVGFYDHVDGGSILAKIIPILAIGYNAQVIEKHFIISRKEKAIDYESSLDAKNFLEFCKILRECEKAIGDETIKEFTEEELKYRAYCKKSIVAKSDINIGEKITREKVMFVRSDPGIYPDKFVEIEGKIAKKNVKKYQNLTYDDF